MSRFYILTASLILFPLFLFSQVNFKRAIYININGDSVHGYIKDMGWLNNPDKFIFNKTLSNDEKEIIDISNASCVIIEGEEVYKRFKLSLSMDENRLTMLSSGPDTSKIVKTVFLNVLVEGCNVNLFSYTDEIKTRYFFTDQNISNPIELRQRQYYSKVKTDMIIDNFYLKQLSYLAHFYSPESTILKNRMKSVPYFGNKLIEIFSLINGGNNSICQTSRANTKTNYTFYASVGLRRSLLDYMVYLDSHKLTANSIKTPSYLPYFGIGLKINSASGSRFYFREEIGFSIDKPISKGRYTGSDYYEDFSYSISQQNLTLSNLAVYNLIIANNLKWNIGAGINLNYSRITQSKYTEHYHDNYSDLTYKKLDILDPHRFWFSIPVKIGITFKEKFDINSSYYIPFAQINDTQINVWEIGLNYYFKQR